TTARAGKTSDQTTAAISPISTSGTQPPAARTGHVFRQSTAQRLHAMRMPTGRSLVIVREPSIGPPGWLGDRAVDSIRLQPTISRRGDNLNAPRPRNRTHAPVWRSQIDRR